MKTKYLPTMQLIFSGRSLILSIYDFTEDSEDESGG